MTSHPINISNVGLVGGNNGYFCKICGDSVVLWAPDETWVHVKDLPPARMVPESSLISLQELNAQQYNRIVFLRMELAEAHVDKADYDNKAENLLKYRNNVHNWKKHHREKRIRLLQQRKAMTKALRDIDEALDSFIEASALGEYDEKVYKLLEVADSAFNSLEKKYPGWDNSWEEAYEPSEDEEGPFLDVEQGPEGPAEEGGEDDSEGVREEVLGSPEAGDPSPRDEEEVGE